MLFIALTVLAALAFVALVLRLVPSTIGEWAMGVFLAGAIVAFTVGMFAPPALSTETYALRALTPGAKDPSYLSVSGGGTGYAYDDNGTLRTASTAARQQAEVREDGAGQPRVEIEHRTYGNMAIAPWSMESEGRIVFHVPAGSALSSATGR